MGSASREHTIERGPKGVLHVTGGKLTTYREMAAQVVDLFAGPEALAERTALLPLPGGDRSLEELAEEAAEVIVDSAVRNRLVLAYGSRWRDVWSLVEERPQLGERVSASHAVIGAEFVFGVQHEMAMTLGDLLIRRTHMAFESRDQARSVASAVAELIAPMLSWTNLDRDRALRDYEDEALGIFAVSGE